MATWQLAWPRHYRVLLLPPRHPPHSPALFKSFTQIYISLHTFFSVSVSICPSFYFCSTLLPSFTPAANEIKRWVSREKDKKLVSNNRAGFVSHVYLFCQKLSNTFQDGLALIIISFFFPFLFLFFSNVPVLLTSENWKRKWCKWDLVCD